MNRQELRDAKGKYAKHPCDLCGKGCPMDYCSDERCNTTFGWGITLHERCALRLENVSDEDYVQLAKLSIAIRNW